MFYFVEMLHIAGMPSDNFEKFKEIALTHEDWIFKKNDKGAVPFFVAIESGNVNIVKWILREKIEIDQEKIVKAIMRIGDQNKRIKMLKFLIEYFEFKKSFIEKVDFLINDLFVGDKHSWDFIKKINLDFSNQHETGNWVKQVAINFTKEKKGVVKEMIETIGMDNILSAKVDSISFVDWLSSNMENEWDVEVKKNLLRFYEEINKVLQSEF